MKKNMKQNKIKFVSKSVVDVTDINYGAANYDCQFETIREMVNLGSGGP